MVDSDALSNVFEALSNPYRRQLLLSLRDHNPQDDRDRDPLNVVAEHEADETVLRTQLVHTHLPKLDDMGFIEWDREHNEIRKGPNWDEIAQILRLIADHRDELPDGWL